MLLLDSTVQCVLCSEKYTVYSEHFEVCSVQCAVLIVQFAVCSVQCKV